MGHPSGCSWSAETCVAATQSERYVGRREGADRGDPLRRARKQWLPRARSFCKRERVAFMERVALRGMSVPLMRIVYRLATVP